MIEFSMALRIWQEIGKIGFKKLDFYFVNLSKVPHVWQ
jgi:hypothetical protein